MDDYTRPQTEREAILLTHQIAWRLEQHVKVQNGRIAELEKKVAKIEFLGRIATAVALPAILAVGGWVVHSLNGLS